MIFLTADFGAGLVVGITAWLMTWGFSLAWRFFQKIITPDNTTIEV